SSWLSLGSGEPRGAHLLPSLAASSSFGSSQLLMSSLPPGFLSGPYEVTSQRSCSPGQVMMYSSPHGSFCAFLRTPPALRSCVFFGHLSLFCSMYCSQALTMLVTSLRAVLTFESARALKA